MNKCLECERVAKYMAADPEFYRDELRMCHAHKENKQLKEKVKELTKKLDNLRKKADN